MNGRMVVVLDIGKTMSKASLWNSVGELVRRETRANASIDAGRYLALDAAGIETWLGEVLGGFADVGPVGSIIPVAHGAAAVVVRDGALVALPMDYETPIPADVRASYLGERDAFTHTGSPLMEHGLNLGLQLHYLEHLFPEALNDDAAVMPWAQYWGWRLSGIAAAEATSLGSHTDLWAPLRRGPSDMAIRRGWAGRLAPLRRAEDVLGGLLPEWSARMRAPADAVVHVGLHDSNAALHAARGFPEIAGRDATVVSTGTWFVSMRSLPRPGEFDFATLSPDRGCLVNVDASGAPAPTSLFMGGREIEILSSGSAYCIDAPELQDEILAGAETCVTAGAMVLPTMTPGVGPFPHAAGAWEARPSEPAVVASAISLYAALVTDCALDLIGATGPLLVDGRFARARTFVGALATLRPQARVYASQAANDVSFGALRLLRPDLSASAPLSRVAPLGVDLRAYRDRWRRLCGSWRAGGLA
ncbi:MAG: carbohydrate kinase [Hyphomonadaceae bacterium]|nr:MAG: carbohydrate kinase [Caulobacteraceae bacterium]MBT9447661.1 carbohydrate kinase [Hyphomonadaceae bacterium]TPW05220.1 MAG: carbohydrate kinase [Alphaproteobacteria bacterium]